MAQPPPEHGELPPDGQQSSPPTNEGSLAFRIGEAIGRIIAIPLMIILALGIAWGVMAIFRALTADDDKNTPVATRPQVTAAPTSAASATATPTTAEPAPTTKPKPVPVEQQLRSALENVLGESNRNRRRLPELSAPRGGYIVLTWAIDENLTEGLTKDTARLEGMKILKTIEEVEESNGNHYTGAFLKGTFSLVDKYGNTSEEIVVRAGYDKGTVNRINFDNISFKNIFDIADRGSIHPAFQY